ncbi:hypothetical protein SAMN06264855_11298 [Halorubrum vacuolatum]|uniref:Uncharacterized protein n=1 Tax=Halorubrum vacuolatum TaxID=63740 RepID=A0A238X3T5_HALVU|nr:hypothetical protein SAMN06264855_11298 [Halorubrum vacuolatum]
MQDRAKEATKDHDQYEAQISEFTSDDIYRFQTGSGTSVKVAVKSFDLLD